MICNVCDICNTSNSQKDCLTCIHKDNPNMISHLEIVTKNLEVVMVVCNTKFGSEPFTVGEMYEVLEDQCRRGVIADDGKFVTDTWSTFEALEELGDFSGTLLNYIESDSEGDIKSLMCTKESNVESFTKGEVYEVTIAGGERGLIDDDGYFNNTTLAKFKIHQMLEPEPEPKETSYQEGGNHYQMPIQPIEFILKNGLGYCEGNVVKYVSRHRNKNGSQDIKKAIQYLTFILDDTYGIETDVTYTERS